MSKNITIHSDGFGGVGTVILDEDGVRLEHVRSLNIEVNAGEPVRVDLEILGSKLIIKAGVRSVQFLCPGCDGVVGHECDPALGGP